MEQTSVSTLSSLSHPTALTRRFIISIGDYGGAGRGGGHGGRGGGRRVGGGRGGCGTEIFVIKCCQIFI